MKLCSNNFKRCMQGFFIYRWYLKYDYTPLDKLRIFLDESWEIKREPFMCGVISIRNKYSGVNTSIIKNSLLMTDMDLCEALCKSLLKRNDAELVSNNKIDVKP